MSKISTYDKFLLTEVTATGTNLNKKFELVGDKINKISNAHMSTGTFRVLQFNTLIELDNHLKDLPPSKAIIAGIPKYENMYSGNIVSKGNENLSINSISRSNNCFTETLVSDIVLDFDFDEQMPEVMKNIKNEDDLMGLLLQILPELTNVECFIRKSSSSSIYNTLTNEFINKDKFTGHLHFIGTNCTKENLNNFIEYLIRKSVQMILAYLKIHKDSSTGFRTLIDLAPLKSMSSRLVFEAEATAISPLTVQRGESKFYNQGTKNALDLSKFNPDELPDYKEWYKSEKKRLKPKIEDIKSIYKQNRKNQLKQYGLDDKNIEKILSTYLEEKQVSCNDFLIKADGSQHKIIDLLEEDTSSCYFNDLVETNKKYKCYISKKSLFDAEIFSYARGGCSYKIKFDTDAIIKLLCELQVIVGSHIKKCLLALENLLIEDSFTKEEIFKIEEVLLKNELIMSNHGFKERIFYGILEQKSLKLMANYGALLSNGSFSIIDLTQTSLTVYKVGDVKNFFKNKMIRGFDVESNKTKSFNPVDIWMQSPKRKEFTGITFDPSMSCPDNIYNQFRGFKYEPKNLIDINLYHDLLRNVICSGDEFMYGIVWSFFAQLIQEPEDKLGVALVFLSKMGTGKGTAIQPIVELLDGYSLVTADSNTLFGRFAAHSDCLLCYYNEASELNYNKSLISKFKHIVTEKVTNVEIKNGPIYSTKSCLRLILDSNEDKLLHETADSRRTWYLPISEAKIGDKVYFKALYDLFATSGFYETLMYQLSTFDFRPWKPLLKNPIRNEVMIEQHIQSLNEICSWWLNCLQEGEIFDAYYELTTEGLKISNQELYNSYTIFTRKSGKKVYDQKVAFGKMMKKHCIDDSLIITNNAKDKKNDNSKVYADLDKCISYFINKQKLGDIEFQSNQWKPSKRQNEIF